MSENPSSPLTIEIWSDVVCPWCYIGKRKFESGLAAFREANPDTEVTVSYRAFQLDPTAPPGVSQLVSEVYAKKFGGVDKATEILATVTAAAVEEGLDFHMDIAQRANTLFAHRLIAFADRSGRQHAMKERIMQAYFTEGKSIGDPDTLAEIAVDIGFDFDEVEAFLGTTDDTATVAEQLSEAADMGITSVPTFVFNRAFGVPGAQSPEYFVRVMEKMSRAS